MALAIRMSRGGRKNLAYYTIVVADKRYARDGRFLEKVGTFNPLLPSNDERRVVLNKERIQYWLGQGAQPSDRVARFLAQAGMMDVPKWYESPKKSAPKAKAQERIKEKEEKRKAAEEAAEKAKAEAEAAKNAPAPAPEPEQKSEPAAEATPEAKSETASEEPKTEG